MIDVSDFIKRAAKRVGFKREFFIEKNIPTQTSNILAIPFYGDLRSTFILSAYFLKSYKEVHKDKYIILCSWPGFHGIFPYVDEYWSIENESATRTLAVEANNLYNGSNLAAEITRSLMEVFNILTVKDLKMFYNDGFTKKYWQEFSDIKRYLPNIPSANMVSADFKLQLDRRIGKKVIIYPAIKVRSWYEGKLVYIPSSKEFWDALAERLLVEGYNPVIYQNWFTYDLSRDFVDKCIYLVPHSVLDVLAAMRYIGCVLDIHSGISRLALAARCPYVSVTERRVFTESGDYELDDLSCQDLPRKYIFSFSTNYPNHQLMIGDLNSWNTDIIDNVIVKLGEILPTIKDSELPSTNESYGIISYDNVRKRKARRLGMAFIKTSKER